MKQSPSVGGMKQHRTATDQWVQVSPSVGARSADQSLGVAIVGCGLIGQKRAQALGPARLVACADVALERAQKLAQPTGAVATADWRSAVVRDDVSIVVVATTNDALAEVTVAAVQAGKHV